MNLSKTLSFVMLSTVAVHTMAADFSFDRPGTGFGTSITPVGQLAWEQGLPTVSYDKSYQAGEKQRVLNLNADTLLRTGLMPDLELQLGWQGPAWTQTKYNGKTTEDDGLGDISIGVKKAIDLGDERLSMAILAEAVLATGNSGFSNEDDIYSLSSAVAYVYNDLVNTSITMRYEVQDGKWAVTAVPTFEYQIAGKLSGFSEFVYRKAESRSDETSLASGLMYQVNNRTQLDASVGVGLAGDTPDYQGGLGISYLF